jgi:hypothetical protein
MDDWDKLYNELIGNSKEETKKDDLCCDNMRIVIKDYYEMCINCGSIDMNKPQLNINEYNENHTLVNKYIPYKRIIYFKQKLNLINNVTLYKYHPCVLFFIECNKNKNFKNIYKLRMAMKRANLSKYYKYIYSIFYAITGKQLITIPCADYQLYINQFINIEKIFNKNKIRHNLYSYNVLLYFFLRLNNNKDYKNVLMPLNKVKLKKKIKALMLLYSN